MMSAWELIIPVGLFLYTFYSFRNKKRKKKKRLMGIYPNEAHLLGVGKGRLSQLHNRWG